MGSWQERINQRLREERTQAQEVERKKAQEENEERLRREQQRSQQKTEARKIIARGKDILSLLDKLNARRKLEEVRRDLWRGLGEIRESVKLPSEDSPVRYDYEWSKGSVPFKFERSVGLFFESSYGVLVPDRYDDVTTTWTGRRHFQTIGGESSEYGTWHDTEKVLASLKQIEKVGGSSLVIAVHVRLNTENEATTLDLNDRINGSLGIHLERSSYFFTSPPHYVSHVQQVDPKSGLQTASKILDDFLLESGVKRASGGLLPYQFGDIVARGNSATLATLEQSRRKLPWHKKLF